MSRPYKAVIAMLRTVRDVLRLVAQGGLERRDRGRPGRRESTIKTHVGRILMKLHLRDRVQAVVWSYEHGVVVADPG
jgi:DNA-binding NarL/FixJ family response regulator